MEYTMLILNNNKHQLWFFYLVVGIKVLASLKHSSEREYIDSLKHGPDVWIPLSSSVTAEVRNPRPRVLDLSPVESTVKSYVSSGGAFTTQEHEGHTQLPEIQRWE